VFNPSNDQSATVTATFFLQDGQGSIERTRTVAPRSRWTLLANEIGELAGKDFATTIQSDVPVVAERSMYWGPGWSGGTSTMGAAEPAPVWYFAEGAAAPNFDTYLTILNPTWSDMTVDITFQGENGQIGPVRAYDVAARSRATVWVTGEVGHVGAVGAKIASRNGKGIVCERSTYWGAGQWVEGANALGVTQPAPVWHLPEGVTINGFDTFLMITNPNSYPVRVRIWPVHNDIGRPYNVDVDIEANGRETIWVNYDARFPREGNATFSILVESLSGAGIIAEHAIYWHPDSQHYWRGGSAAFGIPRSQ
jgi:hypothetical protein